LLTYSALIHFLIWSFNAKRGCVWVWTGQGKAGHCLLAGVVFLFAYRVLHYADPKTLFIDDMGEDEEEEEEEDQADTLPTHEFGI
jgi:hypothetical protein